MFQTIQSASLWGDSLHFWNLEPLGHVLKRGGIVTRVSDGKVGRTGRLIAKKIGRGHGTGGKGPSPLPNSLDPTNPLNFKVGGEQPGRSRRARASIQIRLGSLAEHRSAHT